MQLTLDIQLDDFATFTNFYSEGQEQVVAQLQYLTEDFIFICGPHGAGKTHLLQAAAATAREKNKNIFYTSFGLEAFGRLDVQTDVLNDLESFDLIILDDLDNLQDEQALFHAFNRIRDAGKKLIVSAQKPPALLDIQLPDLKSRLSWGATYQLKALDDEQKIAVLQFRAQRRGFEIKADVANYIVNHYSRDLSDLMQLLDKIDQLSLEQKRKVTIPLIKLVSSE